MVRISKDYDERKKEILDTARMLFYTNGYEQTSVNNIIDKVGISKGTFYYYFNSKEEVLDSLVEQSASQILELTKVVVEDDKLNAVEKLNRFFAISKTWKITNKDLIIAILKVLYRDDNIIIRHKMLSKSLEMVSPQINKIIKQGIDEGVFNNPFPEDAGELIFGMGLSMWDISSKLLLKAFEEPKSIELLERKMKLYENAIERILSLPEGSILLINREELKVFFSEKQGG